MQTGKCRSCGADIVWIETAKGKSHPCDPGLKTVLTPEGIFLKGNESHFKSCPDADLWRKKKNA